MIDETIPPSLVTAVLSTARARLPRDAAAPPPRGGGGLRSGAPAACPPQLNQERDAASGSYLEELETYPAAPWASDRYS